VRRFRLARVIPFGAGLGGTLLLAGCGAAGSAAPAATAPAATAPAATAARPLSTSLVTTHDSWAIVPMASNPAFWEIFSRPLSSPDWKLVTPPGVADNGGLVVAGSGGSLTVAVRPSQNLTFSPLAASADGGGTWSTGLVDAAVAASPSALAVSGSQVLALLGDGTVVASADGGNRWRTLAGPHAITGSAAGRECGLETVTDVSFGITGTPMAAGTCATASTGVFAYSGGSWQAASPPLSGRVVRMTGNLVLAVSGARLRAAWRTGSGWSVSAPLPADGVVASGTLGGDSAWVLLPGGRAATIAGPGDGWRPLPAVPTGTAVLAAGAGGAIDALATHGSTLRVWQLEAPATAWSDIQIISVPI
jgi:hypothetical protein